MYDHMDSQPRQVAIAPWLEFDDPYLEDWFWYYVYRNEYLKTDFIWVVLNFTAGLMAAMKLVNTSAPAWTKLLCIWSSILAGLQGLFIWLQPERYVRRRNTIIAACRIIRILQAMQLLSSLNHSPTSLLTVSHRLFLLSPAGCNCLFSLAFPLPFRTQLWLQLLTASMAAFSGRLVCQGTDPSSASPLFSHFLTIEALSATLNRFTLKLVPNLVSESPADTCWPTWSFAVLLYGYVLPCLLLYVSEARARTRFMAIVTYQEGLDIQGLAYTMCSLCVSLCVAVGAMTPVLWECILLMFTRVAGAGQVHYDWLTMVCTVVVVESGVKVWGFTCMCYVLDALVRPALAGVSRFVLHGL